MTETITEEPQLARHLVSPRPPPLLASEATPPLSDREAHGLDLILEGFLLHHGTPRLLDIPDGGLRVLAGDYCYAQGLARVTESGDLVVVDLLSTLISQSSGLVARDQRDALAPIWAATTLAIADPGSVPALAAATAAVRTGDADPLVALSGGFSRIDDLTAVLAA